ncbi:unnamed protein product [Lupinus luteus]|uniref:Uncharacterized protein n=1 Tax=Lupinus luteus TaxID=3873 RepID=A0AAV1XM36_LUPLU
MGDTLSSWRCTQHKMVRRKVAHNQLERKPSARANILRWHIYLLLIHNVEGEVGICHQNIRVMGDLVDVAQNEEGDLCEGAHPKKGHHPLTKVTFFILSNIYQISHNSDILMTNAYFAFDIMDKKQGTLAMVGATQSTDGHAPTKAGAKRHVHTKRQ